MFSPNALFLMAVSLPVLAADSSTTLAALEQLKLANNAMTRQQSDRALALSKKALAVLEANPTKPAELTQADWDKRRTLAIGTAHWIAGVVEGSKNDFYGSNKDLRAALPVVKDKPEMASAALFFLGVANYQLGRQAFNKAQILEGARFSEQCAAIQSSYQVRAYDNAKAMKKEAAGMP